jgi:hypothetical protein
MAQPKRRRTSFKLLLKTIWCFIARHEPPNHVGMLQRKGFPAVPLYQCPYCNTMFLQMASVKKVAGKVA